MQIVETLLPVWPVKHDSHKKEYLMNTQTQQPKTCPPATKALSHNSVEDFVDLLMMLPVFKEFSRSELRMLTKYMNYQKAETDEYIFKEGDTGSFLCFVAKGTFEVLKGSHKGVHMRISLLKKGDSIGEMAVIDDYPRSASVRAKTSGALITLNRDSFDVFLDHQPHTGIKLLRGIARLLCSNLRKTSQAVVDQLSW